MKHHHLQAKVLEKISSEDAALFSTLNEQRFRIESIRFLEQRNYNTVINRYTYSISSHAPTLGSKSFRLDFRIAVRYQELAVGEQSIRKLESKYRTLKAEDSAFKLRSYVDLDSGDTARALGRKKMSGVARLHITRGVITALDLEFEDGLDKFEYDSETDVIEIRQFKPYTQNDLNNTLVSFAESGEPNTESVITDPKVPATNEQVFRTGTEPCFTINVGVGDIVNEELDYLIVFREKNLVSPGIDLSTDSFKPFFDYPPTASLRNRKVVCGQVPPLAGNLVVLINYNSNKEWQADVLKPAVGAYPKFSGSPYQHYLNIKEALYQVLIKIPHFIGIRVGILPWSYRTPRAFAVVLSEVVLELRQHYEIRQRHKNEIFDMAFIVRALDDLPELRRILSESESFTLCK